MKIDNVRMGFATNSSSSHSIVILDRPAADRTVDGEAQQLNFGWENFVAASKDAKSMYLAAQIYRNLVDCNKLDPRLAMYVIHGLFDNVPAIQEIKDACNMPLVDHQSILELPMSFHGKGLDVEFIEDMKKFVLDPKITVLGGNDNSDGHPLEQFSKDTVLSELARDTDRAGALICRKNRDTGEWVLFNKKSGTKIRMRLDLEPKSAAKAEAPELVDVKITDYCPFGCGYCYQGSTPQGNHASLNKIESLAYNLAELKVFEVALGGGEPTLHPHFVSVLSTFNRYNITPNVTTKNISLLDSPSKLKEILDKVGGIAFSVDHDNCDHVGKILGAIRLYDLDPTKFKIQTVFGVMVEYQLNYFLEECHQGKIDVTMLGFKHQHRGAEYAKSSCLTKPADVWKVIKQLAKKGKLPTLGVDTCIVQDFKAELDALEVNQALYYASEGMYSCYIDLANRKDGKDYPTMAPSSFCSPNDVVPLSDLDSNVISETFKSFK